MCAHDAEGALGIGIGTAIEGLGLHAVLRQLEIDHGVAPDAPVHLGGPVEPRRGFVLHTLDWGGQDTVAVVGQDGPLWALSGTTDVLKAIAAGTGPSHWLVALGYAGWGEGQLDGEMTTHGWFNTVGDTALLYAVDVWRTLGSGLRARRDRPAPLGERGGAGRNVRCDRPGATDLVARPAPRANSRLSVGRADGYRVHTRLYPLWTGGYAGLGRFRTGSGTRSL